MTSGSNDQSDDLAVEGRSWRGLRRNHNADEAEQKSTVHWLGTHRFRFHCVKRPRKVPHLTAPTAALQAASQENAPDRQRDL